jgi:hypothetical protein
MSDLESLYREVHLLAFYYHWTESEILSLTRSKRQRYLALLAGHLERGNGNGHE